MGDGNYELYWGPRKRVLEWDGGFGREALIYSQMNRIGNQAEPKRYKKTERIFYDGDCGVCHWAVSFVARRDPAGLTFRFAPLHGDTFRASIDDQRRADLPDSLIVHTEDDRLLMRSQGLIHILKRLGAFWRLWATLLWLVPSPLRDFGYDLFARYRKRWLRPPSGVCPVLPPELRARFDI